VIRNYHYRSLQYQLQPILYMQGYPRNPAYAIKVSSQDVNSTISAIGKKWKETYPGNVFSYYFLDEKFNRQYVLDLQLEKAVGALTVLAIIISFLGLFGLSLYTVSRRTREVGIRKVLGATSMDIVFLLSVAYVKLMMVGALIGIPIAYQLIQTWLQGYAYQMPMDVSLYIFPIIILALLTMITVSIKTAVAASRNPVESLRYE
jgi:putative ABC transport system permease protein